MTALNELYKKVIAIATPTAFILGVGVGAYLFNQFF
jgi:hypothetical protein